MKASELYLEFVSPEKLCGLCANHGYVDTRGKLRSHAGVATGVLAWCICPNGRSLRRQLGPEVVAIRWGDGSVSPPQG